MSEIFDRRNTAIRILAIAATVVLLDACAGAGGPPVRSTAPGALYSTAGVPVTTESRLPPNIAVPLPLRAGTGRVALVTYLNGVSASGGHVGPAKRVILAMDDGTLQYVDTYDAYWEGERIEILPDLRIATVEVKGTPAPGPAAPSTWRWSESRF